MFLTLVDGNMLYKSLNETQQIACYQTHQNVLVLKVVQAWGEVKLFIWARQNDGLARLTFQLTHLAWRHRWMGKMTLTHIRPAFLCKDRSMTIRK